MVRNSLADNNNDKVSSSFSSSNRQGEQQQRQHHFASKAVKSTISAEDGGGEGRGDSKRKERNSKIQVGIDSFVAAFDESSQAVNPSDRLQDFIKQIEYADQVGLDIFGIGEHHRREFLDSAPALILAAAAARTKRIRLTSAVTVLSAADPVRVFEEFATIDLLSKGRAEMVVGRGSFVEAFPLFGLRLEDYDSLFEEKLDLLLKIRDNNEHVHWSGKYRPRLTGQGVYPTPLQNPLPIWLGVGGTPESLFVLDCLDYPLW